MLLQLPLFLVYIHSYANSSLFIWTLPACTTVDTIKLPYSVPPTDLSNEYSNSDHKQTTNLVHNNNFVTITCRVAMIIEGELLLMMHNPPLFVHLELLL